MIFLIMDCRRKVTNDLAISMRREVPPLFIIAVLLEEKQGSKMGTPWCDIGDITYQDEDNQCLDLIWSDMRL